MKHMDLDGNVSDRDSDKYQDGNVSEDGNVSHTKAEFKRMKSRIAEDNG